MKSLWQWEKHDVVNYLLRANFLETDVEFTTESLIKKLTSQNHCLMALVMGIESYQNIYLI